MLYDPPTCAIPSPSSQQNVRVNFPTSSGMLHLWLEVRWSPTIEDDFLSDLDLPAVELVVGASKKGRHSRYGGRDRAVEWESGRSEEGEG